MGRHKSYDRADVLTKAMNLFWRSGFEGAHLNDLVDATGLNRFSLYKEFGGKEGLFEEALEQYLGQARAAYKSHLAKEPLGLDNIRAYFEATYFSPGNHGCFMINTLTEKHIVSGRAFEMARRTSRQAERLYLNNLKAARASGELAPDATPSVLAKLLLSFDQGLAVYGITHPNNRERGRVVEQLLTRLFGPRPTNVTAC